MHDSVEPQAPLESKMKLSPSAKERIVQFVVAAFVVLAALMVWGVFVRADAAAASSASFVTGDGLVVSYEDGKLTALEEGEPIPEDRIIRHDNVIILLDEDGRAQYQLITDGDGDVRWSGSLSRGYSGYVYDISESGTPLRIGVTTGSIGDALAAQLGLDEDDVGLIQEVEPDSPAEAAGLRRHDIITQIGDRDSGSWLVLRQVLEDMEEGDVLTLKILRSGKTISVDVTPERRELRYGDSPFFAPRASQHRIEALGLAELRERGRAPRGGIDFVPRGEDGQSIMVYPDVGSRAVRPSGLRDIVEGRERIERLERLEARLERLEALLAELVAKER